MQSRVSGRRWPCARAAAAWAVAARPFRARGRPRSSRRAPHHARCCSCFDASGWQEERTAARPSTCHAHPSSSSGRGPLPAAGRRPRHAAVHLTPACHGCTPTRGRNASRSGGHGPAVLTVVAAGPRGGAPAPAPAHGPRPWRGPSLTLYGDSCEGGMWLYGNRGSGGAGWAACR